jgi:hypothetical protein
MNSLTDRLYLAWLAGNCPEVTGHRGGLFYKDVETHRPGSIAVMRPARSVSVLGGSVRTTSPDRRGAPLAGGGGVPPTLCGSPGFGAANT